MIDSLVSNFIDAFTAFGFQSANPAFSATYRCRRYRHTACVAIAPAAGAAAAAAASPTAAAPSAGRPTKP